ncbi:hypothetical protein LCGC14_2166750, partial [marine sediment metagenome]
LRTKYGDDTAKWVDKIAEVEVVKMSVRGDMLDVIFVK